MSSLIRCAAALVLAGALSGVCFAQDQGPDQGQPGQAQSDQGPSDQGQSDQGRPGGHRGALRAACQADIAKLCSAEADGHGGAFRCLRDHQDSVSDACKSAMATARAERQARGGGPQGGWSRSGGPANDTGSNGMGPSNDAQPQN
jgi:hypothetical protein